MRLDSEFGSMVVMPDNYDVYRAALERDAREAILPLYAEVLYSNPRLDPAESRSRLEQYNNGHPDIADEQKLRAAEKTFVEVAYGGGTPLEATVAAKMVLSNDREQQKEHGDGPKELDASEKLDQHIEQTRQQQPELRSPEQELEKYMQGKNRELAGQTPYQDLQKKQDLGR